MNRPFSYLAGALGGLLLLSAVDRALPQAATTDTLQLEAKIPLGKINGRIDHMAVDLQRGRLFVAELGNNTVGVVDLNQGKVAYRIAGLSEPQGIAYLPTTDTIFVANRGDGSVRVFRGGDYAPVARLDLEDDADNVRFDRATGRVLVGFGSGGIAVIDPSKNEKIADTPLAAHPESFQIAPSSGRVYVNLPKASSLAVLASDLRTHQIWKLRYGANYAMTLDTDRHRVLAAFRQLARLVAYDEETGKAAVDVETCGDIDDLFYDSARRRIYVICGSGVVGVLDAASDSYARIARLSTAAGARTGLFVPELNALFVAVRGHSGGAPAIWKYRLGAVPRP